MEMPDKAMAAYDQGLSYTPNAPALWCDRGALLRRIGLLREAQQCFERAIGFDNLNLTARRLLGDVQYDQERYRKALEIYTEIVQLNPRAADVWARLGACQLHLKQPRAALRSFDMALKINPELEEAHNGVRQAQQALL
jgi:tetratricopeptide (TPR) repeat protein